MSGTPSPRRSFALLSVAAAAALAVLVGLGTWQVNRLAEKEALIASLATRLAADPVALPAPAAWPDLDTGALAYTRVRLTGTFDHGRELHVYIVLSRPKGPAGGQGYFVVTPMTLDDGTVVLVNRGFVPSAAKDPATRAAGQIAGPVTITGLLRPPEPRTLLSPADDPVGNVWFVRDPATMAAAAGLDPQRVAPFTVDAEAGAVPGGLPQGGETIVSFPNNHLGYAITWYGLAAVLAGVWGTMALRRRRGGEAA